MTRITGTLLECRHTFMIISRSVLHSMRMFQTEVVQKVKTHILHSVTFFKYRGIYEIMWKNTVESDRPQMTT